MAFVCVFVWNFINFHILVLKFDRFAKDFFNSWDSKETKRMSNLSDFKESEAEDKVELMLFVVAYKTNKCILRFINQVVVLHHFFLDNLLNVECLLFRNWRILINFNFLASQEIYVRIFRLCKVENTLAMSSCSRCSPDPMHETFTPLRRIELDYPIDIWDINSSRT